MRAAICEAVRKLISEGVDGSGRINLYGNVHTKNLHFDEISSFPCCTVTPGVGTREYLPSGQTWKYLDVRIRLYVKNEEDPETELEQLIGDIENLIDANLSLEYTVTNSSGQVIETDQTTDSRINSVITDEGILSPLAFAEISLQIQYMSLRR